jgi:hypothetical protein
MLKDVAMPENERASAKLFAAPNSMRSNQHNSRINERTEARQRALAIA